MISSLVLILQILCLSWWIGGCAVMLFVVTPRVTGNLPGRMEARVLLESLLRRFRGLLLADLIALGIIFSFQLALLSPSVALRLRVSLTLVAVAAFIEAYGRFASRDRAGKIVPEEGPDSPTTQPQPPRFLMLNFFIGVAVVIMLITP